MSNDITVDQWRTVYWEKPTDKGIRNYQARVHQDLCGDWILTKAWGRRGTRLGRVVHIPCASYQVALQQMDVVMKKREQRGYRVICF